MSSSLSSLIHNLAEGLHNNKCKIVNLVKDELLDDNDLTKRFANTNKFCNGNINNFS